MRDETGSTPAQLAVSKGHRPLGVYLADWRRCGTCCPTACTSLVLTMMVISMMTWGDSVRVEAWKMCAETGCSWVMLSHHHAAALSISQLQHCRHMYRGHLRITKCLQIVAPAALKVEVHCEQEGGAAGQLYQQGQAPGLPDGHIALSPHLGVHYPDARCPHPQGRLLMPNLLFAICIHRLESSM